MIGYGSLEQDEADPTRYRLRLLMEGRRIAGGEADPLMDQLERDLVELCPTVVWERVDRDEPELFEYLQQRRMRVMREVTVGPYRYVTVERLLRARA